MSKLIEKIKRVRDERDIKQAAMAWAVEVEPGTISKWLDGKGNPDPYEFRRWADFLKLSMDYLTDDAQEEPPAETPHVVRLTDEEFRILQIARDLGLEKAKRRLYKDEEEPPKLKPDKTHREEMPASPSKPSPGRRHSS